MEYVNLSNINERVIKFGLSVPERYKNISISDIEEFDPWWNVHLIVEKSHEKKSLITHLLPNQ